MYTRVPYLPAVASSEQDENGAGGDGAAQLAGVLAEGLDAVAPQLAGHILCGVVAGLQEGDRDNIRPGLNYHLKPRTNKLLKYSTGLIQGHHRKRKLTK